MFGFICYGPDLAYIAGSIPRSVGCTILWVVVIKCHFTSAISVSHFWCSMEVIAILAKMELMLPGAGFV